LFQHHGGDRRATVECCRGQSRPLRAWRAAGKRRASNLTGIKPHPSLSSRGRGAALCAASAARLLKRPSDTTSNGALHTAALGPERDGPFGSAGLATARRLDRDCRNGAGCGRPECLVDRVACPGGPRPPSFACPTHQPFSQAPKPPQVAVRTNGSEGCVRSRVVVVLDRGNRLLFAA